MTTITRPQTLDRALRRFRLCIVDVGPADETGRFPVTLCRKNSGTRGGSYRNVRLVRVTKPELDDLILVKRLKLHPDFKDRRKHALENTARPQ